MKIECQNIENMPGYIEGEWVRLMESDKHFYSGVYFIIERTAVTGWETREGAILAGHEGVITIMDEF